MTANGVEAVGNELLVVGDAKMEEGGTGPLLLRGAGSCKRQYRPRTRFLVLKGGWVCRQRLNCRFWNREGPCG